MTPEDSQGMFFQDRYLHPIRSDFRSYATDCGLLAGTMRAELLASGALYEGVVTLEELREAVRTGRRLIAFNAVRGVYRLRVEESRGAMASASLHSRL